MDVLNVSMLHSGIPGASLHCTAQSVQVAVSCYLWEHMYPQEMQNVIMQALKSEDKWP